MNFLKLTHKNADVLGVVSSTLCMIHCLFTPILFVAQAEAVSWWKGFNYFFIILSFFAVHQSTKNTSRKWITPIFWTSWFFLTFVILNEELKLYPIPESLSYIVASTLILIHFYSLKYCQCKNDACCTK